MGKGKGNIDEYVIFLKKVVYYLKFKKKIQVEKNLSPF